MVKPTKRNDDKAQRRLRSLLLFCPFGFFVALVGLLSFHLADNYSGESRTTPTALHNHPAPELTIDQLIVDKSAGAAKIDRRIFFNQLTLVNFWGSWCLPCREEHDVLLAIARDNRLQLIGINFKDSYQNAKRFIETFGNPYRSIGFDPDGRTAINWGVYGPPESFLVDRKGYIIYKHVGPLTPTIYRAEILPLLTLAQG